MGSFSRLKRQSKQGQIRQRSDPAQWQKQCRLAFLSCHSPKRCASRDGMNSDALRSDASAWMAGSIAS
jgi:hypothetical protein